MKLNFYWKSAAKVKHTFEGSLCLMINKLNSGCMSFHRRLEKRSFVPEKKEKKRDVDGPVLLC